MINVTLDFEQADEVLRAILLEDYRTILHNQYSYYNHPEDLVRNAEVLHAISVLMDYISVGNDGKKALEAIHDKYRYHNLIASMGDGGSN